MTDSTKALLKGWFKPGRALHDHMYTLGVLLFGVIVTVLLFTTSSRYEKENAQSKLSVNAEIVATSLDLLISNQTIRIQNYENDLQSFLTNIDENNFYTAAILRNSLFTKMIRLRVEPESGAKTAGVKLVAQGATDQDVSPASNKNLKSLFNQLVEEKRKYLTFFFTHENVPYFALAWSLPFKKNTYLLFLGDANRIFTSEQVITDGMSIILEQDLDSSMWLIQKKDKAQLAVQEINPAKAADIKSAQATLYHYKPRFSDSSYNLTFFSTTSILNNDSRSLIVLFSGLTITLLLTMLIHSLTRRNIEVRQLVDEKTAHLKIESEKAKEAAFVKTRFLANVSHEIRTPLNIIMGMLDLMKETSLTKKQVDFVQNMNSASSHLVRLIDDILDMARIDTQDVKFKFESVDFLKFIEEIVHLAHPICKAKGLKFYFKMDDQFPSQIYTDPSRLKQVLINLINNAVKFTETGKIELEVNYIKKGPITTQTARVEFLVRDTGVGIPKAKQHDIFKAFYQVNPSTTRNKSGVGLGLAIVRAIISRLNGNIHLESDLGKGTEFRVELPLVIENSSPWIQKYSSELLKHKKILVVHDSQESYVDPVLRFSKGAEMQVREKSWNDVMVGNIEKNISEYDYLVLAPNEPYQKFEVLKVVDLLQSNQKALVLRTLTDFPGQTLSGRKGVISISAPVLPSEFFQALGAGRSLEQKVTAIKDLKLEGNKSIVIVDDDPSNLLLLKAYLEGQTFKVRYANHGQNALALCEEEIPDVLIADLQMPEMDGFTLVRELRKKNVEPLKVVILTADAQEETIQEATQLGIEAYLTKPIRKAEFLKALVEVFK